MRLLFCLGIIPIFVQNIDLMRHLFPILTFCLVVVACGNIEKPKPENEPKTDTIITRTVLYRPGDYDSRNYRIPAIITAKDASLVIATDKRKYNDADLPEDIDILINRSTDGGRTWSEPYTLMEGQGVGKGFGDCALVRTNDEGGLLAAFVGGCGFWQGRPENPLHTYIARSYDNGQTWTEPKDITDELYGAKCANEVSRT